MGDDRAASNASDIGLLCSNTRFMCNFLDTTHAKGVARSAFALTLGITTKLPDT